MTPSSDRICIHYILLEEENTMIINVFLKASTRANTKYYSATHMSQNKVKLNIIHGRPNTVCPSSAKTTTEGKPLKKKKMRKGVVVRDNTTAKILTCSPRCCCWQSTPLKHSISNTIVHMNQWARWSTKAIIFFLWANLEIEPFWVVSQSFNWQEGFATSMTKIYPGCTSGVLTRLW